MTEINDIDYVNDNDEFDISNVNCEFEDEMFKLCPNFTNSSISVNEFNSFCDSDKDYFLNIMHVNCRSLKQNFHSLEYLLSLLDNNLTAACVSETWLSPSSENSYNLNGYDFVCKSRTSKIGGGVGIYINNTYNYQLRNDLSVINEYIECVFVEIIQSLGNVLIGCVYRPPGSDISNFTDYLTMILDIIYCKRCPPLTFLSGDFNIDLLKSACHSPTADFLMF